jgi:cytochrome c biogenesis protein CcmG/thiol:disulfide interchange protein DsbE
VTEPIRRRLAGVSRARRIAVTIAVAAAAAVCCAVVVAAGPGARASNSTRPLPLARAFSLPQLGRPGHTVSLAAYAGRPVVINFFASWCSPCQRETPLLARFSASQHGQVLMIGIDSNDTTAAALRFVRRAGVTYPVGSDPFPASATTSYGVYALPQTFFLNARHQVVSHVLGPVTMAELTRGVALMDGIRRGRGSS